MKNLRSEAYYVERANGVIRAIKEADDYTTPIDLSIIF